MTSDHVSILDVKNQKYDLVIIRADTGEDASLWIINSQRNTSQVRKRKLMSVLQGPC